MFRQKLFHQLKERLRRIKNKHEAFRAKTNSPGDIHLAILRVDSALRATPSGTSTAPDVEVVGFKA